MQLGTRTHEEAAPSPTAFPLRVLADNPWVLAAASYCTRFGNKAFTGREWRGC
jgi:hypothetical protein